MKSNNKIVKILIFSFFMFSGINVFSQNSKLINAVEEMFEATIEKDYDTILNMTYPKAFDFLTKSEMKDEIKTMFEGNQGYSVEIAQTIPAYTLSEVFKNKEDNVEFAFVVYDLTVKIILHNEELDETRKELMISAMAKQGLEVEFITNNSLNMTKKNTAIILLRDDITNREWTMINYYVENPFRLEKIIPKSVLDKAKSYMQNFTNIQ